jgi:hypothetical protein
MLDPDIEIERHFARDTRKGASNLSIVRENHFVAVVITQAAPVEASLSATQCRLGQRLHGVD